MQVRLVAIAALAVTPQAHANDWEKFYTPLADESQFIPATIAPESVPSSGNADQDVEAMWRRGYGLIGYSSFNSPNSKTADAVRFGKKLKARYVMIGTKLSSSSTASIPMTVPHTTTSVTNGNASVYGSNGGYASGTYSGRTTTYGSQTTYIPIMLNRFDKLAVYFGEVPRSGLGVYSRELTAQEIGTLETRRALAVRFVRDGSPAYVSDVLPGDIITQVEGKPFDRAVLGPALAKGEPFPIKIFRNGSYRDLMITVPDDWKSTSGDSH